MHTNATEEQWQVRLRAACANYGWGPKEGPVVFEREENGWRLGNGVVCLLWRGMGWDSMTPRRHPLDPEEALTDIEQDIVAFAKAHGLDRP